MTIRSIPSAVPNLSHQKWCLICPWAVKRSLRSCLRLWKKNSLNNSKKSSLIWIARPVPSLSIVMTSDSSSESTCFLIAGKVHQISLSNALIDTPCLLKIRYLRISTFVLLPNNFSRFIQATAIK